MRKKRRRRRIARSPAPRPPDSKLLAALWFLASQGATQDLEGAAAQLCIEGVRGVPKGSRPFFRTGATTGFSGQLLPAMASGSGCVGACVAPVSSRCVHASARASIVGLLAGVCDCWGVFYFALTGRRYIDLKEKFPFWDDRVFLYMDDRTRMTGILLTQELPPPSVAPPRDPSSETHKEILSSPGDDRVCRPWGRQPLSSPVIPVLSSP